MSDSFAERIARYTERISGRLERALPSASLTPQRLHEAMRYSVLNGGKRIRPLLVYATGECLQVDANKLDPPAMAIELIHAFSLVHDDLPAMDDDDLRRGRPTVHRQFDEATAILAADALQPLAFQVLSAATTLADKEIVDIVNVVAEACGSQGMTGGQSIDLAAEGQSLSAAELREMHELKTGALIHASVMAAACLQPTITDDQKLALDAFSRAIGLAFQIRDDILDVSGETEVIGKLVGADEQKSKATWPSTFGLEKSEQQCRELLEEGVRHLQIFDRNAEPLLWLARYIVERGK